MGLAAGQTVNAARVEAWLWIAQRLSALLLAACVAVHLAVIIYATRQGVTAAAILGRTRGSPVALAFYGTFVAAIAMHVPIGLRAILRESIGWSGARLELATIALAVLLLALGLRAIGGLV